MSGSGSGGDSLTYRDAGVDRDAAEALKEELAALVESTRTEGVAAGFGSFGGRFRVDGSPELVASADGVGTKILVAVRAGVHDTVGEDLVNHCVNDILAEGAAPLFFLDYFATGRLEPGVARDVVAGVARGCRATGTALLGGETAEMPGVYGPGEYDLAGFVVGRIRWSLPGREALRAGDRLVALASSGLHTNGYTLARAILFDRLGLEPDDPFPGTDLDVAGMLLRVHRCYLRPLTPALEAGRVRALAHITGGGLVDNLARVLPSGLDAAVRLDAWRPGPPFDLLRREAGLDDAEAYRTWNMGVGMVAVVAPAEVAAVIEAVGREGCAAFECGELTPGSGTVRLQREP